MENTEKPSATQPANGRPLPSWTIPNPSRLPSSSPPVGERLSHIETALAEVMTRLELTRPKFLDARPAAPVVALPPPPKKTHSQRLADLVTTRGSVLVAEAQRELGLAQKDAYRLARAMAHRGDAVLVYEPHGHIDRLRLYRPDRVKLDP